jgi:hypothetical protein
VRNERKKKSPEEEVGTKQEYQSSSIDRCQTLLARDQNCARRREQKKNKVPWRFFRTQLLLRGTIQSAENKEIGHVQVVVVVRNLM